MTINENISNNTSMTTSSSTVTSTESRIPNIQDRIKKLAAKLSRELTDQTSRCSEYAKNSVTHNAEYNIYSILDHIVSLDLNTLNHKAYNRTLNILKNVLSFAQTNSISDPKNIVLKQTNLAQWKTLSDPLLCEVFNKPMQVFIAKKALQYIPNFHSVLDDALSLSQKLNRKPNDRDYTSVFRILMHVYLSSTFHYDNYKDYINDRPSYGISLCLNKSLYSNQSTFNRELIMGVKNCESIVYRSFKWGDFYAERILVNSYFYAMFDSLIRFVRVLYSDSNKIAKEYAQALPSIEGVNLNDMSPIDKRVLVKKFFLRAVKHFTVNKVPTSEEAWASYDTKGFVYPDLFKKYSKISNVGNYGRIFISDGRQNLKKADKAKIYSQDTNIDLVSSHFSNELEMLDRLIYLLEDYKENKEEYEELERLEELEESKGSEESEGLKDSKDSKGAEESGTSGVHKEVHKVSKTGVYKYLDSIRSFAETRGFNIVEEDQDIPSIYSKPKELSDFKFNPFTSLDKEELGDTDPECLRGLSTRLKEVFKTPGFKDLEASKLGIPTAQYKLILNSCLYGAKVFSSFSSIYDDPTFDEYRFNRKGLEKIITQVAESQLLHDLQQVRSYSHLYCCLLISKLKRDPNFKFPWENSSYESPEFINRATGFTNCMKQALLNGKIHMKYRKGKPVGIRKSDLNTVSLCYLNQGIEAFYVAKVAEAMKKDGHTILSHEHDGLILKGIIDQHTLSNYSTAISTQYGYKYYNLRIKPIL